MKKGIYILLISIISLTCTSFGQQSGWVWQNPLPQGNDIYSIKMFNSGTGYGSTPYHLLKTTNYGTNWNIILERDGIGLIYFINENTGINSIGSIINKTTNGGNNWNTIYTFTDFYVSIFNWQNELTGFALQNSPSNAPIYYKTKMYKTTTGGTAWQMVFNDTTININSISLPSASVGYMAGTSKNDLLRNGKFFKTTNQGLTWDSIPILRLRDLQSTYFIDNNSGYVGGIRMSANGPNMLRTTNGGTSWDSIYNGAVTLLHFVNFNTGYGGVGPFRKTTNAGLNWITLNPYLFNNLNIRCFSVYGTENIYLGGAQGDLGKSSDGGVTWTADSKGFNGNLYSIKFFDANTGIAAGEGNGGVYLRTTNSGLSWDTNTIDENYLENIFISNENTAFVAGCGKIFRTTNKGASFTAFPTQSGSAWSDVCFPNENTGYCIYKYRVVDKTTDGGNTWVNILPQSFGEFFTICFINGNTGFFGGSKIFKTTNGGTSWDTVITGIQTNYFCNKLRYVNGILYSIGWSNSQYSGIFMISTNEGINWQIDSILNENIYDISIPVPNVTYLIGYYNNIYKSVNNSPWEKYNIFTTAGYSGSICFVNKDTGFVSTYYGGILKTTNGGGTPIGISPQQNEIPASFSLSQNYPNPFNPVTIISYSLPKNTQVRIIVYDILGRLIKQLVNENQSPGKYSVSFDGTDFASGVYFYTIETPDFTQSRKMVLLK